RKGHGRGSSRRLPGAAALLPTPHTRPTRAGSRARASIPRAPPAAIRREGRSAAMSLLAPPGALSSRPRAGGGVALALRPDPEQREALLAREDLVQAQEDQQPRADAGEPGEVTGRESPEDGRGLRYVRRRDAGHLHHRIH